MEPPQKIGDLEVHQDLTQQHLEWKIQRISWVGMSIILIAALLGLFGAGPLSNATVGSQGDPLWIEYRRFDRYEAPSFLRIHTNSLDRQNNHLRLWIDHNYIDRIDIETIVPVPERVEGSSDRIFYLFATSATDQAMIITFIFRPNTFGPTTAQIGIDDRQVHFWQFFYP